VTSGIVLCAILVAIISSFVPQPPPGGTQGVVEPGVARWDPCSLRVEYGSMHRLVLLVAFGTVGVFTVQGLRNRSGPRWLAIVGLLSLVLGVEEDWWELPCYRTASLASLFACLGAAGVMLLHHTACPARENRIFLEVLQLWRQPGWCVLLIFVSILVIWFIAYQAALLVPRHKVELAQTIINTIQRDIGWLEMTLFPFALIATLHRVFSRTESSKKK
jgi:hypothetical protein